VSVNYARPTHQRADGQCLVWPCEDHTKTYKQM